MASRPASPNLSTAAKRTLVAAAAIAALSAAAPAGAQIVFSENFNGATGSGAWDDTSERWSSTRYFLTYPGSLSGWFLFNQVIVAENLGSPGDRALLLNESPHGIASTSTPVAGLTAGNPYKVVFEHWGDNMPGATPYSFDVLMNGSLLGNVTRAYAGTGLGTFASTSYTFTAPGSSINLTFIDKSTGYASPIIDNLTVAAVPEPETWAMMLAGLSFLGWMSRRRKLGEGMAAA